MKKKFDYTTTARNFALKYPRINFMAIQINFWIIAFLIFTLIMHLITLAVYSANSIESNAEYFPAFLISIFGGLLFGIISGLAEQVLSKRIAAGKSLGVTIFLQGFTYYISVVLFAVITRFVLWEFIVIPYYFDGIAPIDLNKEVWRYYYFALLIYAFAMALVISFINQMNKKFGPGVLLPLLFGRYRSPKEENRVFLFMDLKSSTTIAEKLGHLKYSSMIRDSFQDINKVLTKYEAEIYQYVGDEIVITWTDRDGFDKINCIDFYFDCQRQFNIRRTYYLENYGTLPLFKAGLHQGVITAVEVGEIKRDIAYHGDTLNTASRIQTKCNEFESNLLISEELEKTINWPERFSRKFLGAVQLKGKELPVNVYSIMPILQN